MYCSMLSTSWNGFSGYAPETKTLIATCLSSAKPTTTNAIPTISKAGKGLQCGREIKDKGN